MRHFGKLFKDVPKLYNDQVSKDRCMLEHKGFNRYYTTGCSIPGDSWMGNEVLKYRQKIMRDKYGNPVRGIVIAGAAAKLKEINDYIKSKGYENVQRYIFDFLPADQ